MLKNVHEIETSLNKKIALGFRNTFIYGSLVTFFVFLTPLTQSPASQLIYFIIGLLPAFVLFCFLINAKENSRHTKYYVNLSLIMTIMFSAVILKNPEIFSMFYLITAINMTYRDRLLHFVSCTAQLSSYLVLSFFYPVLLPVATTEDSISALMVTRITIFIMVTFLVDIVNEYAQQLMQQIIQKEKDIMIVSLKDSMSALIQALEAKDIYTNGHSLRTSYYVKLTLAKLNNVSLDEQTVQTGAILHDIGKIGISETILSKPEKLSSDEFAIVKNHPIIGAKILQSTTSLITAVPMVLYHHESYDGTGYPNGLRGEEIPIEARILTVVDAFDAMTSDRPYRKALTTEEAYQEILAKSGQQFCPIVVNAFREAYKDIVEIHNHLIKKSVSRDKNVV